MTASPVDQLSAALLRPSPSERLQAALTAGTHPRDEYVEVLVARSGIEPDFFVRDMLTWALTRHPADRTVPLLMAEVSTGGDQARSQALHSLSKIGDPRGWSAITPTVLYDANDEVARTAWRAAVVLVPAGEEPALVPALAAQLGRGDRGTRLSLSRALADLGDYSVDVLEPLASEAEPDVRAHAIATLGLIDDPDASFDEVLHEATRSVALASDPTAAVVEGESAESEQRMPHHSVDGDR